MASALTLALCASGAVWAQPEADTAAGRKIADAGAGGAVMACMTCHGVDGQGTTGFPPLAGASSAYLVRQLDAFADGSRNNAIMAPIAKGLDEQARADVAAYYASLPSGIARHGPVVPDPADAGAWLVHRGRMDDGIPACADCHGPDGAGVGANFPPIALLDGAYMATQIAAWKSGDRPGGPLNLMGTIAEKLSAADVQAVAEYYAGQRADNGDGAPAQP